MAGIVDEKLKDYAERIRAIAYELIEHSNLGQSHIKYLEKIDQNIASFLDVYERLTHMPLLELRKILNHDIRNLITPVVGYAELLEMNATATLNEHQVQMVQEMHLTAGWMRETLDRMLAEIQRIREEQNI